MAATTPETIAQQLPPSVDLAVETIPIPELMLGGRQLRLRSKKGLDSMAASIRQFGFLVPVVIGAENQVICGKGRVQAARLLGMKDVPCIRVTHLTEAELRC